MLLAKKIRLILTSEQENIFWKSAGTARWSYNYFLSENERIYKEYLENGQTGEKYVSGNELRKYINNNLKTTTHKWLSEVSNNVMKQAVKDAEKAFKDFLAGKSGRPHYKSRKYSKISFYVNYESLKRTANGFRGEKIGVIRTAQKLPKLKKGEKYSNPRITFDGKYWYISVGYEVPEINCKLTDESVGIDLGIKNLAICSNKKVYKNINKTNKVIKLKKVLKRKQRQLSRKLENNVLEYKKIGNKRVPIYIRPLHECRNIRKQNQKIRLLYRKLTNIRNNYLHQITTEIVKTKPFRIVMETLNVKGMMKNKHLSEAIQEQKFYEFKRQITYKCQRYGIKLVETPMFYPSSKLCSCCGFVKKDLKLSDRIYRCSNCGLVIDRDFNASLNLANYKSA